VPHPDRAGTLPPVLPLDATGRGQLPAQPDLAAEARRTFRVTPVSAFAYNACRRLPGGNEAPLASLVHPDDARTTAPVLSLDAAGLGHVLRQNRLARKPGGAFPVAVVATGASDRRQLRRRRRTTACQ